MTILQRVGNNIKKRRNHVGMTVAELSRRTDISRVSIECYEKGIQNITLTNLNEICNALNINISKVFKK